jgi:D-alanyl-D-alanine carboxypeptidase
VSQYGCGVGLRWQDGRQALTHGGAVSGFNAYNAVVPSTRSAVALVSNVDGGLGALPGQLLGLLAATTHQVPNIDGPPAAEMARSLFLELQRGRVDRSRFGEEFNLYLDDAKVAAAAKRLRRRGRPSSAELVRADERGGMEVSVVRLTFRRGSLRTLMYRQPDGRVEQFFVEADQP